MSRLLDHYGEFRRAPQTYKHWGWFGTGAMMKNGDYSGTGIEKLCPQCDEYHSFAQFSVVVSDDAPDDWPSKIPPVGD